LQRLQKNFNKSFANILSTFIILNLRYRCSAWNVE